VDIARKESDCRRRGIFETVSFEIAPALAHFHRRWNKSARRLGSANPPLPSDQDVL
jgi:hypothetical protein